MIFMLLPKKILLLHHDVKVIAWRDEKRDLFLESFAGVSSSRSSIIVWAKPSRRESSASTSRHGGRRWWDDEADMHAKAASAFDRVARAGDPGTPSRRQRRRREKKNRRLLPLQTKQPS